MKTEKDNLPFGKRYGFEPIEVSFQIDSIDKTLRTDLWNAFYLFIYEPYKNAPSYTQFQYRCTHEILWAHYFKCAMDDFPEDYRFRQHVRGYIEYEAWYKIYQFFEFLLKCLRKNEYGVYHLQELNTFICNKLKENNAAYTLINDKFVPVTNDSEIKEIKALQEAVKKNNLQGVQEHLNSAIELISQKPIPDYRNSIKESISMVEVISRIIEPSENTLGKALNKLDKNNKINSTLKAGFEKLYHYTNGKNGIRHAIMADENIDSEDARFFLISCSAFTNYLIEKAKKENLLNG